MKETIIRKARAGEEAAIHEAHMRSIREICIKDHGEEEIRGWGYRPLENRWVDAVKEGSVWVVEHENKIQGVGYFRVVEKDNEKFGNLHALYLTPNVKNKGLGLKLANLLLDEARNQGVETVKLASSITAYHFYKKIGFQDNGEKERVDIGGHPVTCFPMIYNLEKQKSPNR